MPLAFHSPRTIASPADVPGPLDRRRFFDRVGDGLGGTALAWLFSRDLFGGSGLLYRDLVRDWSAA